MRTGCHKIDVSGRPEIPGQGQGNPSTRNDVDETLVLVGMTPAQKTKADALTRKFTRESLTVSERTTVRDLKIIIRDDSGSTDHEVSEAIRHIEAITAVEEE